MTNEDRVFEYLRSISPHDATNSEIAAHTGVQPHAQVFQLTQRLYKTGKIKGSKDGDWKFWVGQNPTIPINKPSQPPVVNPSEAGSK